MHLFSRGGQQFFGKVADEDVYSVAFVEVGDVRGAEPKDYGDGKSCCREYEWNLPAVALFPKNQLLECCGVTDPASDFGRGALLGDDFPEMFAAPCCEASVPIVPSGSAACR